MTAYEVTFKVQINLPEKDSYDWEVYERAARETTDLHDDSSDEMVAERVALTMATDYMERQSHCTASYYVVAEGRNAKVVESSA